MKIYTRQGDKGQTSLASGEKVSKSSLRVEAYGSVDELNSFIGLLRSHLPSSLVSEIDPHLQKIQSQLFNLGSLLASTNSQMAPPLDSNLPSTLESEMDRMTVALPPLRNFILPAGTSAASYAHVCRSVCRRAERHCVDLGEAETLNPQAVILLNRLSDYFFVLARYFNIREGVSEVVWKP